VTRKRHALSFCPVPVAVLVLVLVAVFESVPRYEDADEYGNGYGRQP
jgi:hypothetical protein